MAKLNLGHLELFVRDPERSRDFYRDILGFEVVAEPGPDFVWLRGGDREILLRRGEPPSVARSYKESGVAFVFYTDDLPATLALLKDRGLLPSDQDGGAKCPAFVDPDGHWFQVVNPKDH